MSQSLNYSEQDLPRSGFRGARPGIEGTLKQQPEDFEVEEIPAYEPNGQGEHLFLWIEKRDMSGEQLTWHLARSLGISNQDIGVAGIKDRRAIARQYVSVPARCEDRISEISDDRLQILRARRHENKLRRSHLRGNRFSILLRQPRDGAFQLAQDLGDVIQDRGFPNYFGSQRFGADGENLQTGLGLLTGEILPRSLPRSRRKFLIAICLSAIQSQLFNLALANRIRRDQLFQVLNGDVMQVVESGGKFVVEDSAREQPRFDTGEIVSTGPLFGPKMNTPSGQPAEYESALLENFGLSPEHFRQFPKMTRGTRRPYLVRPKDWSVNDEPDGVRFRFVLPAGAYATSLLREFM